MTFSCAIFLCCLQVGSKFIEWENRVLCSAWVRVEGEQRRRSLLRFSSHWDGCRHKLKPALRDNSDSQQLQRHQHVGDVERVMTIMHLGAALPCRDPTALLRLHLRQERSIQSRWELASQLVL